VTVVLPAILLGLRCCGGGMSLSKRMATWIALLVAGVVIALGIATKRATKASRIDAGQVSESWLREQRAEKQDRFNA
jgi:hypothetical protein